MKALDDLLRQQHLDLARIASTRGILLKTSMASLLRNESRSK
jgi:hypothetical protein